jgi:hypothetical protein
MRNESGTEQKCAWIETLRARGLTAQIEAIDEVPNEQQAKQTEQAWIDYYIQLGCPLTNGEVSIAQRVLDVQSGRVPSQEEVRSLYHGAQHFRFQQASAKALQIVRWYNRPHVPFATHYYDRKAQEYDLAIFGHALPERKAERDAILCNVTIAYLYWNERLIVWQKTSRREDIRYLWNKHITLICTKIEKDGTSRTGFVVGLTQQNVPLIHPFSYNVDPTRALIVISRCVGYEWKAGSTRDLCM